MATKISPKGAKTRSAKTAKPTKTRKSASAPRKAARRTAGTARRSASARPAPRRTGPELLTTVYEAEQVSEPLIEPRDMFDDERAFKD